jgi:anhydro-N-acetylmuramic acid kinase
LIACDTGPGGAILDDWVMQKTGASYDQDGQLGAQGKPHEGILETWMRHPYFTKSAPKSLDRNDFATRVKDIRGLSLADGAATLVEFTAKAIIKSLDHVPEHPTKIYVAGGGRRNKHLMNRLSTMSPCPVEAIEALSWDGDLLEAYAFAYLAARVKAGLPISFPTTTGVKHPIVGGKKVLRPS